MPRVPHSAAGGGPGLEPGQICAITVRYKLSGEGPVSPEGPAWLTKKYINGQSSATPVALLKLL